MRLDFNCKKQSAEQEERRNPQKATSVKQQATSLPQLNDKGECYCKDGYKVNITNGLCDSCEGKEIDFGGRPLVMETGKIARQADGAVMATYGETKVLCTVVAEQSPRPGIDFFPS